MSEAKARELLIARLGELYAMRDAKDREELANDVIAYLAAVPAPPAGPLREPTQAMRNAGVRAFTDKDDWAFDDIWRAMYDAAPAAEPVAQQPPPHEAENCEGCGGSGDAVIYHGRGPYGEPEIIKCRDCDGTGLADPTIAGIFTPFTDAETVAGREATQEANAGVECAHGDNAAAEPVAQQPPPLYAIIFDDADKRHEIIVGEAAARKRFGDVSISWNAHLFVKVASNSRDDQHYANNAAPQPEAPTLADDKLVALLKWEADG